MSNPTNIQDRNVVITIFAPSDTKHREPMQIWGRIAYVGELGDDKNTLEIEVDAKSVELPSSKSSDEQEGSGGHD